MEIRSRAVFFGIIFFILTNFNTFAEEQGLMSVQVREGQVRLKPTFLGQIVARLSYGDQVMVSEEKGSWAKINQVETKGAGWIHMSALTKKKIIMNPGTQDIKRAASSDELALAGKGFNTQVEKEFKVKNRNIDYTWVDKMEKIDVSQEQIRQFLKQGELLPQGD